MRVLKRVHQLVSTPILRGGQAPSQNGNRTNETPYTEKVLDAQGLFENHFLNARKLYLYHYNTLPDVHFIGAIDGEKAYKAFLENYSSMIVYKHQYRWFRKRDKSFQFDVVILVLSNQCVVEFDEEDITVLHNGTQDAFINELGNFGIRFRERIKRGPLEISLIVNSNYGLQLKTMEIKRTKLDLDLYYDDDFKATDELIRKRLNAKNDKGIVLLHGLPGTGKTSYLRYLMGKIKKRILFVSPNVAGDLMSPGFLNLLINNPNTVLIIEDAENIITDRRMNSSSSVSNLLNISDGLLADFLNVQLICTFNNSITMVDSALMRKGRLIAKYEFGKLGLEKAQKLNDHLGFTNKITEPMTLAEICNPGEKTQELKPIQGIGFRRPGTE